MVERNADGSLKVIGQMPDPSWLSQLREAEEPEDAELEEE